MLSWSSSSTCDLTEPDWKQSPPCLMFISTTSSHNTPPYYMRDELQQRLAHAVSTGYLTGPVTPLASRRIKF